MDEVTYKDIYKQFLVKTGIGFTRVVDYRPCCTFYGVPDIPHAIVIQLKNGGTIIYIYDNEQEASYDRKSNTL